MNVSVTIKEAPPAGVRDVEHPVGTGLPAWSFLSPDLRREGMQVKQMTTGNDGLIN
jgi:hypothetical protein